MPEKKNRNPVEFAARWVARKHPPRQASVDTNYSKLGELLGVPRQAIQRYRKSGRFPMDRMKQLIEISDGELTEEDLRP